MARKRDTKRDRQEFRQKFRMWMEEHGLDRNAAAALMGVSPATANAWARGHASPSTTTVRTIAVSLGTTEEKILSWQWPAPREENVKGKLPEAESDGTREPRAESPLCTGTKSILRHLHVEKGVSLITLSRAVRTTRYRTKNFILGGSMPSESNGRCLAETLDVPLEVIESGDASGITADSIARLSFRAPYASTPFGNAMVAIRRKYGMGRKSLSQAIGINESQLASWETEGKYPYPGLVRRLSWFFDMSAQDVLDGRFSEIPKTRLIGMPLVEEKPKPALNTPEEREMAIRFRISGSALKASRVLVRVGAATLSAFLSVPRDDLRKFESGTAWDGRDRFVGVLKERMGEDFAESILSGEPMEIPEPTVLRMMEKELPRWKYRRPSLLPKRKWGEMGRRIREIRICSGWTQEDLGHLLEISFFGISHIEGGRRSISEKGLNALLDVLDTDMEGLMSNKALRLPPPQEVPGVFTAVIQETPGKGEPAGKIAGRILAQERLRKRILSFIGDPAAVRMLHGTDVHMSMIFRILARANVPANSVRLMEERLDRIFSGRKEQSLA